MKRAAETRVPALGYFFLAGRMPSFLSTHRSSGIVYDRGFWGPLLPQTLKCALGIFHTKPKRLRL